MKDRGIVVFSGIDTHVIDRITKQLNSNGIDSAFVRATDGILNEDYFNRLLQRTIHTINYTKEKGNLTLGAVLVSGIHDKIDAEREKSYFFPALRRILINQNLKNNPAAAGRIFDSILSHFRDEKNRSFRRLVSPQREARYLLPVANTPCKALTASFLSIYTMDSFELSARVEREIVKLRGQKSYRIRGLDFSPATNNGKHPIRRISCNDKCDLQSYFRFGVPVHERMEFDVSCENGLKGKTFCQCDETAQAVNIYASHLNMRINDDYGVS